MTLNPTSFNILYPPPSPLNPLVLARTSSQPKEIAAERLKTLFNATYYLPPFNGSDLEVPPIPFLLKDLLLAINEVVPGIIDTFLLDECVEYIIDGLDYRNVDLCFYHHNVNWNKPLDLKNCIKDFVLQHFSKTGLKFDPNFSQEQFLNGLPGYITYDRRVGNGNYSQDHNCYSIKIGNIKLHFVTANTQQPLWMKTYFPGVKWFYSLRNNRCVNGSFEYVKLDEQHLIARRLTLQSFAHVSNPVFYLLDKYTAGFDFDDSERAVGIKELKDNFLARYPTSDITSATAQADKNKIQRNNAVKQLETANNAQQMREARSNFCNLQYLPDANNRLVEDLWAHFHEHYNSLLPLAQPQNAPEDLISTPQKTYTPKTQTVAAVAAYFENSQKLHKKFESIPIDVREMFLAQLNSLTAITGLHIRQDADLNSIVAATSPLLQKNNLTWKALQNDMRKQCVLELQNPDLSTYDSMQNHIQKIFNINTLLSNISEIFQLLQNHAEEYYSFRCGIEQNLSPALKRQFAKKGISQLVKLPLDKYIDDLVAATARRMQTASASESVLQKREIIPLHAGNEHKKMAFFWNLLTFIESFDQPELIKHYTGAVANAWLKQMGKPKYLTRFAALIQETPENLTDYLALVRGLYLYAWITEQGILAYQPADGNQSRSHNFITLHANGRFHYISIPQNPVEAIVAFFNSWKKLQNAFINKIISAEFAIDELQIAYESENDENKKQKIVSEIYAERQKIYHYRDLRKSQINLASDLGLKDFSLNLNRENFSDVFKKYFTAFFETSPLQKVLQERYPNLSLAPLFNINSGEQAFIQQQTLTRVVKQLVQEESNLNFKDGLSPLLTTLLKCLTDSLSTTQQLSLLANTFTNPIQLHESALNTKRIKTITHTLITVLRTCASDLNQLKFVETVLLIIPKFAELQLFTDEQIINIWELLMHSYEQMTACNVPTLIKLHSLFIDLKCDLNSDLSSISDRIYNAFSRSIKESNDISAENCQLLWKYLISKIDDEITSLNLKSAVTWFEMSCKLALHIPDTELALFTKGLALIQHYPTQTTELFQRAANALITLKTNVEVKNAAYAFFNEFIKHHHSLKITQTGSLAIFQGYFNILLSTKKQTKTKIQDRISTCEILQKCIQNIQKAQNEDSAILANSINLLENSSCTLKNLLIAFFDIFPKQCEEQILERFQDIVSVLTSEDYQLFLEDLLFIRSRDAILLTAKLLLEKNIRLLNTDARCIFLVNLLTSLHLIQADPKLKLEIQKSIDAVITVHGNVLFSTSETSVLFQMAFHKLKIISPETANNIYEILLTSLPFEHEVLLELNQCKIVHIDTLRELLKDVHEMNWVYQISNHINIILDSGNDYEISACINLLNDFIKTNVFHAGLLNDTYVVILRYLKKTATTIPVSKTIEFFINSFSVSASNMDDDYLGEYFTFIHSFENIELLKSCWNIVTQKKSIPVQISILQSLIKLDVKPHEVDFIYQAHQALYHPANLMTNEALLKASYLQIISKMSVLPSVKPNFFHCYHGANLLSFAIIQANLSNEINKSSDWHSIILRGWDEFLMRLRTPSFPVDMKFAENLTQSIFNFLIQRNSNQAFRILYDWTMYQKYHNLSSQWLRIENIDFIVTQNKRSSYLYLIHYKLFTHFDFEQINTIPPSFIRFECLQDGKIIDRSIQLDGFDLEIKYIQAVCLKYNVNVRSDKLKILTHNFAVNFLRFDNFHLYQHTLNLIHAFLELHDATGETKKLFHKKILSFVVYLVQDIEIALKKDIPVFHLIKYLQRYYHLATFFQIDMKNDFMTFIKATSETQKKEMIEIIKNFPSTQNHMQDIWRDPLMYALEHPTKDFNLLRAVITELPKLVHTSSCTKPEFLHLACKYLKPLIEECFDIFLEISIKDHADDVLIKRQDDFCLLFMELLESLQFPLAQSLVDLHFKSLLYHGQLIIRCINRFKVYFKNTTMPALSTIIFIIDTDFKDMIFKPSSKYIFEKIKWLQESHQKNGASLEICNPEFNHRCLNFQSEIVRVYFMNANRDRIKFYGAKLEETGDTPTKP